MVVIFLVNECKVQAVWRYHLHFFCVKFGFIKKGSFFCGKDERYVHNRERFFIQGTN